MMKQIATALYCTFYFAISLQLSQAQEFLSDSDSDCKDHTYAQIYAFNPHLKVAEAAYVMRLSDAIGAYCMEYKTDKLRNCDVKLGHSNSATLEYEYECERAGGVMWQYAYSPKCSSSKSHQKANHVLVCASPQCGPVGVQNLIPAPGLLDSLGAAGYICGTGTMNLEKLKAPLSSSGSSRYGLTLITSSVSLLLASAAYFLL